jgi:hypothetical protein
VRGKKAFDLLGPVANHDSDVSNPISRQRTQLHLKHRMVCVNRQKAFGKIVGAGSQTTPIACVQDDRFHDELRPFAIVFIPIGIGTSLPFVAGGANGVIKMLG